MPKRRTPKKVCSDCGKMAPDVEKVIVTPHDGLERCFACRIKLAQRLIERDMKQQ